jgi:hypothetical protein
VEKMSIKLITSVVSAAWQLSCYELLLQKREGKLAAERRHRQRLGEGGSEGEEIHALQRENNTAKGWRQ